jgi:hypothetical protein
MLPVMAQAAGTISKSLRKHLSNTPGRYESKELQKSSILASPHILQKVLMSNFKLFNMGYNFTRGIHFTYRKAATLYNIGKWFVPGI